MASIKPKNFDSTTYSRQRFAHPFYLPAPQSARQPIHGHTRITDWSKTQLGPIPPVKNNGAMTLDELIGADGVREIEQDGEIRFHALGDSGVGQAQEAENISDEMATDYKAGAGGLNPAFLFHLGDVIYGPDKAAHYGDRFYRPYRHYPGKVIAIPGNHDGEVKTAADSPSLKDFEANFCADKSVVPPQAADSGIYRETMTQPGVYWMLEAPYMRIIGLYSNRLENPGYLQGEKNDAAQIDWLKKTLSTVSKAKDKKALIIATHHPPYSQSGHSGSTEMSQTIDEACASAGVTPDLFLSGHSHNYQRYTRRFGAKQVPYIVVGTGGMPPQPVTNATGQPVGGNPALTYDSAIGSHGYLYVTTSARQVKTEFWQLGQQHTTAFDTAVVDLDTHIVR
jgi:calcineurin-like phosphoesterase family protein